MADNLGQYLIKLLEAYEVELVFGIPGVHTAELYRGLATSAIRHVTPRHEQGAGFMADGYARTTGKPGVCLVITGPGLSNIATAMLQARADSIPMLVIAGVNDPSDRPLGRLHEMPDQFAFGGQVAAASWRISDPVQLPAALAEAYALFESKRPGPVLIEIPLSVMSADAAHMPAPVRPGRFVAPFTDSETVRKAAAHLAEAEHPVLLVGGGARAATAQILDLAERLNAAVIPTLNAKSCFPLDHNKIVPATASLTAVRAFVDAADLVLAIGTELGQTDYDVYACGDMIKPKRLIRIDIDPAQAKAGLSSDLFLLGDAKTTLSALIKALPESVKSQGNDESIASLRTDARNELSPSYLQLLAVLETMRDTLPNAILVGDSTQLIYAGNMVFDPGNKGGWFNSSVGFGTLGYALPAGIGAKLGKPDQPVIVLIGDGGIQFTIGELGDLRDEDTPVIVLVWNNSGYGEIKSYMVENTVKPEGVDITPPDFSLLAQAYGIDYCRLAEDDLLTTLPAVLETAARSPASTLIEVRVDQIIDT